MGAGVMNYKIKEKFICPLRSEEKSLCAYILFTYLKGALCNIFTGCKQTKKQSS